MGSVYEGENVRIRRRVAIKILHTTVAESDDAVQRFEREAQAAGRIGSEHIVEVLDLGELEAGRRYMVMEFLEGEALNERILKVGRISPETTAKMTLELLEGLKAAHAVGIIHRDLKPDNVYLLSNRKDRPDYVKIVDFGISKFSTLGGEFTMTRTGTVMGTPYYLSPEQAKGERNVDERSDLYAVGIIMWEACAGRVPFDGETFNELLFKIVLEPIPPLTKAVKDLDPAFAAIVAKAMARDPEERFQSAEEMQVALRNWLQGAPQTAETTRPPAATWEGRQGTIQAVTPGYATATSAGKDASAVTTTGTKPAANFPESPTQSSSTDSLGESQTPRGWADGSGAPAPRGNTGRRNPILTAAIVLLIGGASEKGRSRNVERKSPAWRRKKPKQKPSAPKRKRLAWKRRGRRPRPNSVPVSVRNNCERPAPNNCRNKQRVGGPHNPYRLPRCQLPLPRNSLAKAARFARNSEGLRNSSAKCSYHANGGS
jgi:serine/threonine-protein kinase